MNNGFVYYSVGDECVNEAIQSIDSLLMFMPESNVTVFTDQPHKFLHLKVDTIEVSHVHNKATRAKLLQTSPYDKTFYIDSDTLFIGQCYELFDYLNDNDLCLAYSNLKGDETSYIPRDFPFYNCGVIGYQSTKNAIKILNLWQSEIVECLRQSECAKDEPAFRKVIFDQKQPIKLLPDIYNFRPHNNISKDIPDNVKIIHSHDINEFYKQPLIDVALGCSIQSNR